MEFREVRELADICDERVRQEARQSLDELGREWRRVGVVGRQRRASHVVRLNQKATWSAMHQASGRGF